MTRPILTLLLCAFSFAASAQPAGGPSAATAPDAGPTAASPFRNTHLTYKIIPAPGGTWCYDIYADGRMMIHQPSIPGLPGNAGFKTKASAGKVAQLVVRKIKAGLMPPSVAYDELKRLKAI